MAAFRSQASTTTAAAQISSRFDALKATRVVVQDGRPDPDADPPFPPDAEARLARLNGVRAAGVLWTVQTGGIGARLTPIRDPAGADEVALNVIAATPGALRAVGATVAQGRLFDQFHASRGEHVVLLGSGAARQLGLPRVADELYRSARRLRIFTARPAATDFSTVTGLLRLPAGAVHERLAASRPLL